MKVLRRFLTLVIFIFQASAFALINSEDHKVIKPMPNSQLVPAQSSVKDYGSYQFRIQKGKKVEKVVKNGKYWHLRYLIKNASGKINRNVSREEIVKNYKEAALEKGGRLLLEGPYQLTFTLSRKDGGTTWAFLVAGAGSYNLDIIDEAGFEKQLTFGAEEMKKALDETGRVAIYGIYFDVDKASLKLGAENALIEMVKLMKNNPELKIEIQGHTDDTGLAAHNLTLSSQRAETVKTFLMNYGIESFRMVPKGLGEDRPVASNDTEDGRAQNRRVELVKIN
ncbi:MAG: OmpA family protein [bacterium]